MYAIIHITLTFLLARLRCCKNVVPNAFEIVVGKHYGKPVDWMDATGKELSLWKSMLERPNFWVEGCLSLRPSLDLRIS